VIRSRLIALSAVLGTLTLGGSLLPAQATAAPKPRASLTTAEYDFMCTVCHESLAVAQSPEAFAERHYIRTLIAQGLDERQIKSAMVAQYGPAVLAQPPASGFDLTVYLIPAAILALGLIVLSIVLPRWRRAARARAGTPMAGAPALAAADAQRLDEDLARFD